jgi:hypothetical protein
MVSSFFSNLNIISLGSYDVLIDMDWLDVHHVIVDYHNNNFVCLDDEGKHRIMKVIRRPIYIRDIVSSQLKRIFRKRVLVCISCGRARKVYKPKYLRLCYFLGVCRCILGSVRFTTKMIYRFIY